MVPMVWLQFVILFAFFLMVYLFHRRDARKDGWREGMSRFEDLDQTKKDNKSHKY